LGCGASTRRPACALGPVRCNPCALGAHWGGRGWGSLRLGVGLGTHVKAAGLAGQTDTTQHSTAQHSTTQHATALRRRLLSQMHSLGPCRPLVALRHRVHDGQVVRVLRPGVLLSQALPHDDAQTKWVGGWVDGCWSANKKPCSIFIEYQSSSKQNTKRLPNPTQPIHSPTQPTHL